MKKPERWYVLLKFRSYERCGRNNICRASFVDVELWVSTPNIRAIYVYQSHKNKLRAKSAECKRSVDVKSDE